MHKTLFWKVLVYCTLRDEVNEYPEPVPEGHEGDTKKQTKTSTKLGHKGGPGIQKHLRVAH